MKLQSQIVQDPYYYDVEVYLFIYGIEVYP